MASRGEGGSPGSGKQVNRKIAVLGFRAVGKTTLTTHFVEGRFVERYDPTIENTFQKTIRFKKVQFFTEIVDSAGMDEYSRLSRNASVGVHGYLLLYAANSRNSFSKVQAIDDLLLEMHGGSANVARVLVSTMIDLDAERTVRPPTPTPTPFSVPVLLPHSRACSVSLPLRVSAHAHRPLVLCCAGIIRGGASACRLP
mmetsp:Transcript_27084/g.72952  ORF Transcript_27084/g.72952 Transcript_27084/m.72952 type:complete len:198 (-) Transcript_27084:335-928(-)